MSALPLRPALQRERGCNRIPMKNIMYAGVLAAALELEVIPRATESYVKEAPARRGEHEGRAFLRLGHDWVAKTDCLLCRSGSTDGQDPRPVMIDGNTAARSAACTQAPPSPMVPDHAVHLADGRVRVSARSCVDPETGKNNFVVIQAEGRTVRRSAWCSRELERRARVHRDTSGPGISLMNEFIGALLRRRCRR